MGLSLSLGFPPNTGPAAGGIKPGIPLAAVTLSATAGTSASLIGVHPFDSMTLAGTGAVATNVLGVHTFGSGAGIGATGALAAALRADGPRSLPTVTLAAVAGVTGVLEGGAAAFVPSDIAGLTAWFDFSDISTLFQDSAGTTPVTADADPIGLVTNKGSGGNATQTTTAAKPAYKVNIKNSLAASLWDGGDALFTASAQFIGLDGTFTALVVARDTLADNDKRHLFNNGAGGGEFLHVYLNSVRVRGYNTVGGNATDTPGTGYTSATWQIAQSLRAATTIEARMNAAANGATAVAGTARSAADALAIGSNTSSAENWVGYICEAVLYNSLLSADNLALVLAYLNAKWAVY